MYSLRENEKELVAFSNDIRNLEKLREKYMMDCNRFQCVGIISNNLVIEETKVFKMDITNHRANINYENFGKINIPLNGLIISFSDINLKLEQEHFREDLEYYVMTFNYFNDRNEKFSYDILIYSNDKYVIPALIDFLNSDYSDEDTKSLNKITVNKFDFVLDKIYWFGLVNGPFDV